MNDETKNALIVVAAGAVGAYAYLAFKRAKAAAAAAGNTGGDVCANLAALSPSAAAACTLGGAAVGIVKAVAGKFQNETGEDVDAHNVALNGPIVERNYYEIDSRFWELQQGHVEVWGDGPGTMSEQTVGVLKGRQVPRHQNGCVPLSSNAANCAPGTKGYARSGSPMSGVEFKTTGGGYVTDGLRKEGWNSYSVHFEGDPLTHRHWKDRGAFPLQCGSGTEPWWLGGRPQCCPPGFQSVRDQRDGGKGLLTCQKISVVLPMGIGSLLTPTPISAPGTKPDENTQGGRVVTIASTPRNVRNGSAPKPKFKPPI